MNGLLHHLALTVRLNLRDRRALALGYLVPVFFLFAFGSVFRSSVPPLANEMGQLLTITILGGACFGLPTAMVSERERGVWRRYQLLPTATAGLVVSAMVARYLIILVAAVLQIGLARGIYRTPLPAHPAQLLVAYTLVCFAFLGLGLIIAMLAETVPTVQALGQAIFLPMIMIGGIGVPLRVLPAWVQHVAGFLPGRYAVEALNECLVAGRQGLHGARFALVGLFVIGAAACVAGAKLFRWDPGQRLDRRAQPWILVALVGWAAVGVAAEWTGYRVVVGDATPAPVAPSMPPARPGGAWEMIGDADLAGIDYSNLPRDDGLVVPFASSLYRLDGPDRRRMQAIRTRLLTWKPAVDADLGQRVRALLCVCAVADVLEDEHEGEIALTVLDFLRELVPTPKLRQALAWIVVRPADGSVVTRTFELGIPGEITEAAVRERSALYAKKFLLRLPR